MTPERALELLRAVWGERRSITHEEAREIDRASLAGKSESAIDTVGRIAGVRVDDLRSTTPDVARIIRERCDAADAANSAGKGTP